MSNQAFNSGIHKSCFDVFLYSVTLNELISYSSAHLLVDITSHTKVERSVIALKKHLWMPVVIQTKSVIYVLGYSTILTWIFVFP